MIYIGGRHSNVFSFEYFNATVDEAPPPTAEHKEVHRDDVKVAAPLLADAMAAGNAAANGRQPAVGAVAEDEVKLEKKTDEEIFVLLDDAQNDLDNDIAGTQPTGAGVEDQKLNSTKDKIETEPATESKPKTNAEAKVKAETKPAAGGTGTAPAPTPDKKDATKAKVAADVAKRLVCTSASQSVLEAVSSQHD